MAVNQLLSTTNTNTATYNTSSTAAIWTGRIMSGLIILFLLADGASHLLKLDTAVEGTIDLGYPESVVVPLGLTLLACTILYAVPRTAIFGAILLTGYLGGAVATNVRLEDIWFLLPFVTGVLLWVGLYLRDHRLQALVTS